MKNNACFPDLYGDAGISYKTFTVRHNGSRITHFFLRQVTCHTIPAFNVNRNESFYIGLGGKLDDASLVRNGIESVAVKTCR